MENKKRTTVYIDEGIKQLIISQNGNLSAIVGELLEQYAGTNTIETCKIEIKKAEKTIKIMQKKIKTLKRMGVKENKQDVIYSELLQVARNRISHGTPLNVAWITSPKNTSRCRVIGKDCILLLDQLKNDLIKEEQKTEVKKK